MFSCSYMYAVWSVPIVSALEVHDTSDLRYIHTHNIQWLWKISFHCGAIAQLHSACVHSLIIRVHTHQPMGEGGSRIFCLGGNHCTIVEPLQRRDGSQTGKGGNRTELTVEYNYVFRSELFPYMCLWCSFATNCKFSHQKASSKETKRLIHMHTLELCLDLSSEAGCITGNGFHSATCHF